MKRPTVVLYNQISLNGALYGFEANPGLYYELAARVPADAILVGSETARTGLASYGEGAPPETEADFAPPRGRIDQPYWVIPDSRGTLQGILHAYRRFDYCREVVVLITEKTPAAYREYLEARNYPYAVMGRDQVDLAGALAWLTDRFDVEMVRTDSGPRLNSLLLQHGLVDEVILLLTPVMAADPGKALLTPEKNIRLQLKDSQVIGGGYHWLWYEVIPG